MNKEDNCLGQIGNLINKMYYSDYPEKLLHPLNKNGIAGKKNEFLEINLYSYLYLT